MSSERQRASETMTAVSLRKLNTHQRLILVVGLAIALYWIGRWIIVGGSTGWIAYAPLSGQANPGLPFLPTHIWAQLLIWLGLTLVWVVCSLFIMRSTKQSDNAVPDEQNADPELS
jgi:heme/copper-type cytochrome/quinol oxidase subunit 1